MTASPDPHVGLPSEEEIRQIVDAALNSAIPEPWEVSVHATQRILSLIRPAFEAKEREIEQLRLEINEDRQTNAIGLACWIDKSRELEAKLAQAVEEEREACARRAEQQRELIPASTKSGRVYRDACSHVALHIRARGKPSAPILASAAARGETR